MRGEQGSADKDSRLTGVIRGLVVSACFVPLLHTATCARHGHEVSQYRPFPESDDPGPWALDNLERFIGDIQRLFGITATLCAISILLSVMVLGNRTRLMASFLYGPVLLFIGIEGFRQPDLHRWLWASISLLAGAILSAFVASRALLRWSARSLDRASLVAMLGAGALAALFASLNLPAQTDNRILSTSPLFWTYHRAEWKRDPYETMPGWKCTTHEDRCDCVNSDEPTARGACVDQRCCYSWDNVQYYPLDGHGPSYPAKSGCFCVPPDPARGLCPSRSSFSPSYNASNSRKETCP